MLDFETSLTSSATHSRPPPSPCACARARWTSPHYSEQQRIHRAVEPGAAHTHTHREEEEDGRGGIVRSGPVRVHYRPDYLRQTAADHPQSALLDIFPGGLCLHRERGLRQLGQRAPPLRLQQERGRLQLRRVRGPGGPAGLLLLLHAGLQVLLHQLRQGQEEGHNDRDRLLGRLDLPVLRGLLLPGQSVVSDHGRRAATQPGGGRGPGGHRLLFLLHHHLGRADGARGPEVSARHGHDSVHHGAHGRRRPHPAVPLQLAGGRHRRGPRDLPEPAFHREQRGAHVPGSHLLGRGSGRRMRGK